MMAKEGYAIVPMREYLSMHDELAALKTTVKAFNKAKKKLMNCWKIKKKKTHG